MNKEELLELLDSLGLPKEEYYILGSGSLLLYGIREKATDLDLCVSKELFKSMITKFNIELSTKNECGFYRLNGLVEVVVNDKQDFNRAFKDGYPVESLQVILNYKINRNAPKDQVDINNIQLYLDNNEISLEMQNNSTKRYYKN